MKQLAYDGHKFVRYQKGARNHRKGYLTIDSRKQRQRSAFSLPRTQRGNCHGFKAHFESQDAHLLRKYVPAAAAWGDPLGRGPMLLDRNRTCS